MGRGTKAVILAGGKGTRFHPFSFTIPKPLMPIGEEPILLHLINRFKMAGIKEFLVSVGYHAELIQAYFGNGDRFGIKIDYFKEDQPLGTAGPLSLMRDHLKDEDYFFLINGDIYTEMSFDSMREFAIRTGHDLVVGYVEKIEKSPYGVLNIEKNVIQNVTEKPERRFNISSGIYAMSGRVLKHVPDKKFFTVPDLMSVYLQRHEPVGAYRIDEFWMGIEDVENLDQVLKRLNSNQLQPKAPGV